MIDLRREGEVYVLSMDAGENRFLPDFTEAWGRALDEVEAAEGAKALVTVGTGRFYSNGLDVDYMGRCEDLDAYVGSVLAVMKRILVFPAFTVAAINGHAFGAGAQIALAHDTRLMRADRGYFCMPEIDMRAHLHPGMTALIQARLPHQSAHELIVTGTRYPAELALSRRIVDEALSESELLPRAIEVAAGLASKAHPVMSRLKAEMYPHALEALEAKLTL